MPVSTTTRRTFNPPRAWAGFATPPPATAAAASHPPRADTAAGRVPLLISDAQLATLPTTGTAWDYVTTQANAGIGTVELRSDNDAQIRALAAALVWRRNGSGPGTTPVADALKQLPGQEDHTTAQTLRAYRQLSAWVTCADLIDFDPGTVCNNGETFGAWLDRMFTYEMVSTGGGAAWQNVASCARVAGHNWGCYARVSMVAMALYRGNTTRLTEAIGYHRRWLGDLSYPNTFNATSEYDPAFGWQIDNYPTAQGVINRDVAGDDRSGCNVEDACRTGTGHSAGTATWDGRTLGNMYQLGCLEAVIAMHAHLRLAGYTDVWTWGNEAPRRNGQWLANNRGYVNPYTEQLSTPYALNKVYGTAFPTAGDGYGRAWGFGRWLCSPESTWLTG